MLQGVLAATGASPYEATLTLEKGDVGRLLRLAGYPLPDQAAGVGSGRIEIGGSLGTQRSQRATVDLETAQLDIRGRTFRTQGQTRLTFHEGKFTIPARSSGTRD
jgi:hypothetical protein